MPTERFFNLPEEKQKRIVRASLAEFGRVPFEEISINRIIQVAGIPRGSFYQYFEDKQDLRSFLMEGFNTCLKAKIDNYLEQKKGDLFQFFKDALAEIIREGTSSEEQKAVCRHAFSQMRYGGECLKDLLVEEDGMRMLENVIRQMQKEYYPEYTIDELMLVGELLAQQIKETVAVVFIYEEMEAQIVEKYYKKLDLIEAGMRAAKERTNV